MFLPTDSPDLNPVEEVFSKVKGIMKNDALFQVTNIPRELLTLSFAMVTKEYCLSYITHSGF